MELGQARVRVEVLRSEIDEHNRRYHVLDQPEISDAEFDALMQELIALEAGFPALVVPESPTQRIDAARLTASEPVAHAGDGAAPAMPQGPASVPASSPPSAPPSSPPSRSGPQSQVPAQTALHRSSVELSPHQSQQSATSAALLPSQMW